MCHAPFWNVTIVCFCHNSIHNSYRVPVPSAFRNLCISWFNLGSFLLLREFYKLQSKINLFFSKSLVRKRLREVFTIPGAFATPDVQTTYSIILLLAQILKMKQLNQMKRVVLGTKEVKRVSLLNQRYRFLILSQIKSVDQLKQVVVLRWPLRTLTHCGHKANILSRCTRWPLRQTNVVVPDTVTFAADLENWASLERPKASHIDKSV